MNAKLKNSTIDIIDDEQFLSEIFGANEPILAAFLAPESEPCRRMEAVLDDLASSFQQHLKILKLNVNKSVDLSEWYGVQDLPTLLCFVHGKACARIVGKTNKRSLVSKLTQIAINAT